jgi:cytochrome d ubiquinol oxidase subunit I
MIGAATLTFLVMTALYVVLGIIVVWLLSRHVIAVPDRKQLARAGVLV